MGNIIAVVNNRNYALQLATNLKRRGVRNKVVDTPREVSSSCGISVVFDQNALYLVKQLILQLGMGGYVKLYKIATNGFQKYYLITS